MEIKEAKNVKEFTFTARSIAQANNYLKLIYNGKKYALDEFAGKFQDENDKFALDKILENCKVEYKENTFTFKEMCDDMNAFCDLLPLSSLYADKIYPVELDLLSNDEDYFASGKLVKSVEDQLMFGRFSLIESQGIIDFNLNCNWSAGYQGVYFMRSVKANNAIMWYNNVFDSIMQIVFIAFGIYKKHPRYSEKLTYHQILKLCDYNYLSGYYGENKATVPNLKDLWKIVTKAQNENNHINNWANFIKHKGGIKIKGVDPENPYEIIVGKTSSNGFEPPELELDTVVEELKNAHITLCNTLAELVDFIGFEKIVTHDNYKKSIIHKESYYKKVLIN